MVFHKKALFQKTNNHKINYMEAFKMVETLYNINGEEVTVEELENGAAAVKFENGSKRVYNSYDEAINRLYKKGFQF
jgi:coenzyme F420-reducing hydrogenase beta subunit